MTKNKKSGFIEYGFYDGDPTHEIDKLFEPKTLRKSTGYIVDGIYHKASAEDQQGFAGPDAQLQSITYKAYEADRQRQEHGVDLIQPWKDGMPNEEFRIFYPEESEKYFGKHQV